MMAATGESFNAEASKMACYAAAGLIATFRSSYNAAIVWSGDTIPAWLEAGRKILTDRQAMESEQSVAIMAVDGFPHYPHVRSVPRPV
jgi:hypothetical protein